MSNPCKHSAYTLRNGVLVCQSCGEPSPSARWQANVYGQQPATSAGGRSPGARRSGQQGR